MIHREEHNSIALLRIEHGKVNAIDVEMFSELRENLREVQNGSAKAVVLTGTGKTFSAGVDLFRLLQDGKPYVEQFVPLLSAGLEDLFLFPKPLIVLLNGHAIAGGCIMACACDHRIAIAGDSKMGVPEVLVGVPFPPIALEIMRYAASQHLQEIVYGGKYYNLEDALRIRLIDEIAEPEGALNHALNVAERFAAIPARTFQLTKHQLRKTAIESAAAGKARSKDILDSWADPEVHEVIRGYLSKAVKKS